MDAQRLTIGGKAYVLPPLRLRLMPRVAPHVDRLLDLGKPDGSIAHTASFADACMGIVAGALSRDFPDKSETELRDHLEADFSWAERFGFCAQVLDYLTRQQVLATPSGTEAPAGEAAAPVSPENGSVSTGIGMESSSSSPAEGSAAATPA